MLRAKSWWDMRFDPTHAMVCSCFATSPIMCSRNNPRRQMIFWIEGFICRFYLCVSVCVYACVCGDRKKAPHTSALELQAFVGHLTCYMHARVWTLVLRAMQQALTGIPASRFEILKDLNRSSLLLLRTFHKYLFVLIITLITITMF